MESIGFKEWALVCGAVGRGEQSVLLRKGGLAEGRDGFAFRHAEFFLFPTYFHAQTGLVRIGHRTLPEQREGTISIDLFVKVEEARLVTNWNAAAALAPWHVLEADVVRERFDYDGGNGVHVALIRAYRLQPTWMFGDQPRYGGCRSWVKLPAAPTGMQLHPVLADEEQHARAAQFERIVDAAGASSRYAIAAA